MSDINEVVIPKEMADLEWVWVLTTPRTKISDSIFVLDIEEKADPKKRRIVPIFETSEDAAKVKLKMRPTKAGEYSEQAMKLGDVSKFAAQKEAEIMMKEEEGNIMAHMEDRLEQHPLH